MSNNMMYGPTPLLGNTENGKLTLHKLFLRVPINERMSHV